MGSFWQNPIQMRPLKKLFESEAHVLIKDLYELLKFGAIHKLNDLIQRARSVKVSLSFFFYLFLQSSLKFDSKIIKL